MLENQVAVDIGRPLDDVFAFLSDLRNETKYVPELLETRKITEGPIGVGTRYREVNRCFSG